MWVRGAWKNAMSCRVLTAHVGWMAYEAAMTGVRRWLRPGVVVVAIAAAKLLLHLAT